ncbi:hypothetical protein [Bacillus manliponensis]
MKKIVLTVLGIAFILSITTGLNNFNDVAVNKGDGGAPAFAPIYKQ